MRALILFVRNVAVALVSLWTGVFRLLLRPKPVEWVVFELDGLVGRGHEDELPSLAWRLPRHRHVRSVAELRRALGILSEIPTVQGVVVKLGHLRCGGAVMRELRAELLKFREGGKQVVVHAEQLQMRDYWLASAANRIWLVPRGRLELVGFAASATAAARPLKHLGIAMRVVRAGAFKSAGEAFGAEKVSEAALLQLDELVGDIASLFVKDVAEGRKVSEDAVRDAIDRGPYAAAAALEAKLVDGLCYADEVREKLGDGRRVRLGTFAAAFAAHAGAADWKPLRDARPTVAVVDVEGVIASGKSRAVPLLASTAGSESLVQMLNAVRRRREVKAVVLRIDSRGGSALASDVIWRAAKKLASEKPVVAFLDDVAASGGYYIAAAAERIVASPTCITGSIGVFMVRPDASGAFAKAGVDRVTVQRGRNAALFRREAPLTAEAEEALQRDVHATYEEFLEVVAEGRRLPRDKVREVAEGRVYLAGRAQEAGLVDSLGTLDEAVREAAGLAKLVGPVRTVRTASRQSGWRELYRQWKREGARSVLPLFPRDRVWAMWPGESPL